MENINKYQVAAKCIFIMRNQLGETNHPAMREYITEKINYLSTPGVLDMYKIITYSNCIALVCDRYDYYPCFKLFNGRKDFLVVCIILIILGNMLQSALKPSLGHVNSNTVTLGVILIPYLFFVYKRAKDTGLQKIVVIATTILAIYFFKTVGFILFFIPTGVIGKEEFRREDKKERKRSLGIG